MQYTPASAHRPNKRGRRGYLRAQRRSINRLAKAHQRGTVPASSSSRPRSRARRRSSPAPAASPSAPGPQEVARSGRASSVSPRRAQHGHAGAGVRCGPPRPPGGRHGRRQELPHDALDDRSVGGGVCAWPALTALCWTSLRAALITAHQDPFIEDLHRFPTKAKNGKEVLIHLYDTAGRERTHQLNALCFSLALLFVDKGRRRR